MTIELELQLATDAQTIPHPSQFREWVGNTLKNHIDNVEMTIRIVDEAEMTELNSTYRKKVGPTNVLSFPADKIPGANITPILGDIIICAPIVQKEAQSSNIDLLAHWAHMVVHGTLHLMGYDHIKENDAQKMEQLEEKILTKMGYPAPYGDNPPND